MIRSLLRPRSIARHVFNRAIRLSPRSEEPYKTHVPILLGISALVQPKIVTEFGSGQFSTALFLDQKLFPYLSQITSFENDAAWFLTVKDMVGGDDRIDLRNIDGEMFRAVSPNDLKADAIFIDDSNAEGRVKTIEAIAHIRPQGVPVIIHDAEIWDIRRALRNFQHHFVFDAFNPQTAVVWNGELPCASAFEALNHALRQHSNEASPGDGSFWINVVRDHSQASENLTV